MFQCWLAICSLLAGTLAFGLPAVPHEAQGWRPIRYLALGDSYAAGDGAGCKRLWPQDAACGRFSQAYTYQILNNTEPFFATHWPYYMNHACSGATTTSLMWKQLPFYSNKDLITIQVGGNEVGFFTILNECIQQWRPVSTCDRELTRARSMIQSMAFAKRFDDMLGFVKKHSAQDTLIFVLGYAKFFNADTDQCNGVTFSFTNPANVLSNELRQDFNELVAMLNDVIRISAEAHGIVYVDIDTIFEGHRFCDAGVEEPRADNEETWFFREAPEQTPARLQEVQHRLLNQSPLWASNPFKKFADLTRTFHPTINGHAAIAETLAHVLGSQLQVT